MKLFIILGNQLFNPKYLSDYKDHTFFMAEDYGLCTFEKHHKLKILLFLSSMRSFRDELKTKNFNFIYKDVNKAFNLYTSASRYGHPQATFNLANMHYSGVGTVKNIKKAYKLFLIAKINGIDESEYYLKKINPNKSILYMKILYLKQKTFTTNLI